MIAGQLTEGLCGRPQLSTDHQRIAFEALRDGPAGEPSIGLYDTGTQEIQWLEAGEGCSFPSFSRQGNRLAVSCGADIFIIDLITGQGTLIADCSAKDNACTDTAWSPDGATILAYRATEFQPNPGIYRLDTACLENPATCPAEPQFFVRGVAPLAWSPTGDKVAFITFEGDLGIASPEGQILDTYDVPKRGQVRSMAWSEEGDMLAVSLNTYSNGQDSYLVSFPKGEWRRLSLAEGDSLVEFWVTTP